MELFVYFFSEWAVHSVWLTHSGGKVTVSVSCGVAQRLSLPDRTWQELDLQRRGLFHLIQALTDLVGPSARELQAWRLEIVDRVKTRCADCASWWMELFEVEKWCCKLVELILKRCFIAGSSSVDNGHLLYSFGHKLWAAESWRTSWPFMIAWFVLNKLPT